MLLIQRPAASVESAYAYTLFCWADRALGLVGGCNGRYALDSDAYCAMFAPSSNQNSTRLSIEMVGVPYGRNSIFTTRDSGRAQVLGTVSTLKVVQEELISQDHSPHALPIKGATGTEERQWALEAGLLDSPAQGPAQDK